MPRSGALRRHSSCSTISGPLTAATALAPGSLDGPKRANWAVLGIISRHASLSRAVATAARLKGSVTDLGRGPSCRAIAAGGHRRPGPIRYGRPAPARAVLSIPEAGDGLLLPPPTAALALTDVKHSMRWCRRLS